MTLGRLVVAWIVVAVWFEIATVVSYRVMSGRVSVPRHVVVQQLSEAVLITLLASLWFDSLGSGGWWLLFALIGGLMSVPQLFLIRSDPAVKRAMVTGAVGDFARYLIAGALLAWRLS